MESHSLFCLLFLLSALYLFVLPAFSADYMYYDRDEKLSNHIVNQIVDKFVAMKQTKQICLAGHPFQINSQNFLALGGGII